MRLFSAWIYEALRCGTRRRAARKQQAAARAANRVLGFESLESRRLLAVTVSSSSNVLMVNLTAASDTATIQATSAASGGAQSIQVAGTGFVTAAFAGTKSIVINYGAASESATLQNGVAPIALGGALTVNDSTNAIGETLTFASSTTYSFGSVSVWTSQTGGVGTVNVNNSLTASNGTLTIGTGTASTSPVLTFGGTGTISATGGDIDISAKTTLLLNMTISDAAGTVRLVSGTGISDSGNPITAKNLSAVTAAGNVVLEGSNSISGVVALSSTNAVYTANVNGISFNNVGNAVTIGATTAVDSFGAVTGVSATNGDADLKGAGITINNAVAATGAVRLVSSGSITQAAAGTITAASLSVNQTGGNAVLEAANSVATLAGKNLTSGDAISFNNTGASLTVGSVAGASTVTLDPNFYFNTAVAGVAATGAGEVNLKSAGSVTISSTVVSGAAATGIVRILAAGNVSQTATITALRLGVKTTTGNIVLEGNNIISVIAAQDSASGAVISFNDNTTGLTVGSVAASAVGSLFGAPTFPLNGISTSDGDVNLKSLTLAVTQAISVGSANARFVTGGSVSETASVSASSLGVFTTVGNIVLEGTNSITTLAAKDTSAGGIISFNNGTNPLTIASVAAATAGDTSSLFGPNFPITGLSTTGSGGDINVKSGALTLTNAVTASAGNVRLLASGNITQAAAITASGLAAVTTTGNIILENTNNVATFAAGNLSAGGAISFSNSGNSLAIGTIGAAASGGDTLGLFGASTFPLVGISTNGGDANIQSGSLAVNQPIGSGTGAVRLVAGGNLTQAAAGGITAGKLSLSLTAGSAVLEATNNIGALAASDSVSGAAISVNNGTNALAIGTVGPAAAASDPSGLFSAAVDGMSTTAGDVNLRSGALAITRPLSAAGAAVRLVTSASVSETASTSISAASLSINSSSGNVVLESDNNNISTLAANGSGAGGGVTLSNGANALTIGMVAVASATADPSSFFAALSGISTANGDVNLKTAALSITSSIAVGSANLRLLASGAISQTASGTITAGGLAAVNSGGSAILASANNVGTLAASSSVSSGTLTFNNNAASLTIGSIGAAAGAVDPSTVFAAVSGITLAGGDANLASGGLAVNQAIGAGSGTVRMLESAGVSQTAAGTITAARLGLHLSGGNAVLEAANAIGTIASSNSSAGSITFTDSSTLTVGSVTAAAAAADPNNVFTATAGISTAGGDANLQSAGLAINQTIGVQAGTVRLSESGGISQAAGGTITAAVLSVSSTGGDTVLEAANTIGTLAVNVTGTGSALTFNNGSTALIVATASAAAATVDPNTTFGAIVGVSNTSGDANLASAGLTINQAIAVGGSLRLVEPGGITQAVAGTITAGAMSVSLSSGSVVLESSNAISVLAASDTAAGSPITVVNGSTTLAVGQVAAAASGVDPGSLFAGVTGVATNGGDLNIKSAGVNINQAVTAGTGSVRFVTSSGIGEAASAVITAAALSASGSVGNLVLEGANSVGIFAASNTAAGAGLTFVDTAATLKINSVAAAAAAADPGSMFAGVTGIATNSGDVNLKGATISLLQPLNVTTAAIRFVSSNTITQGALATITGPQLGILLTNATNVSLGAQNNISNVLSVNGPAGASASIVNNGSPSVTSTVAAAPAAEDPNMLFPAVTGITVGVSDLTINVSHSTQFFEGDNGDTYSIVVSNSGSGLNTGKVTVTDTLPTGLTPVGVSGIGWTANIVGQTLTASRSDNLTTGSSYPTLTLTVNVAANAASPLTNTATVSGFGELNRTNDSSSDVTTISQSTDVSISQTTQSNVTAGSTMTYTVTISNASLVAATGVQLSDLLPSGETFVSQSQANGPTFTLSNTGNQVTDTISSLAAGASATINVTVLVGASVASGTVLTNSPSVSTTGHDENLANNSTTGQTTVQTSADVGVSLIALQSSPQSGAEYGYQIQVANNGPSDAHNVSLSDLLPSNVTFVTQSQSSGPTFTLSNSGNQVTDTISTLAAASVATILVYVDVNSGTADGTVITNTANVSASTSDPASSNNSSSVNVTVGAAGGVAVTSDLIDPTKTDVVVTGQPSGSTITISAASGGTILVNIDGTNFGPYSPTGRIVVYTGNGNSNVTLGAGVTVPAFVFAGSGNDVLINQGSDNSVLVGGGGSDAIQGGTGFNILIGGSGASRLVGGPNGIASGGSVMIGGSTTFDHDESRLYQMLADWSSGASYSTRMSELAALGMTDANMIPNSLIDQLFASTGQDWYWNISGQDTISGYHGGTIST